MKDKITVNEEELFLRNTPGTREILKNSHVVIMGLGGLGSNVAVSLARMGTGKLTLIDFDTVDISNLNRQHYFLNHIGMRKTDAMEEQLKSINPHIKTEKIFKKLIYRDIENLLEENKEYHGGRTVFCEAFDDAEMKMTAFEVFKRDGQGILVMGSGMAGISPSESIITRKFGENIYICGDGISKSSEKMGLMSPMVMLCAMHEANMILRILVSE